MFRIKDKFHETNINTTLTIVIMLLLLTLHSNILLITITFQMILVKGRIGIIILCYNWVGIIELWL